MPTDLEKLIEKRNKKQQELNAAQRLVREAQQREHTQHLLALGTVVEQCLGTVTPAELEGRLKAWALPTTERGERP